jgi:tRNA dimethylallyltransferase
MVEAEPNRPAVATRDAPSAACDPLLDPILLAGPTAVGKSALALALAERIGGEIVSVDSMQVYRGMDIGTAKPSAQERRRVPHHLLDILDLSESFDAAQFVIRARQAVAEIRGRRRTPILCGGTGLYFKAFLAGLATTPPADPALRLQLGATPLPELLKELQERDPAAFEQIDRRNPRRVVRALEVMRLTGKPFSAQRTQWQPSSAHARPAGSSRFFCFSRSTAQLHARINARVEEMFRLGLVEETRRLLSRGLAQNQTALQALGYHQVVEHLHGVRSLEATIELVRARTRQFARRQMTWFRRQTAATWIHLEQDQPLEAVLRLLRA